MTSSEIRVWGAAPPHGRRVAAKLFLLAWLLALAVTACSEGPVQPASALGGRGGPRTVEEFLAALPERFRSQYVLMRESRSTQAASSERPRVILYGSDGKRVVAFDETSSTLDVMTFDDGTDSFVFQEVTFSASTGHAPMAISEPNPAKCRACHGTPARPVWDSYPVWPGAFGEVAARSPSPEERRALERFLALQPSHPRYRYLVPPRATGVQAAEHRYLGQEKLSSAAELTTLLSALNARAIARELRASPAFERQRYALLSALVPECGEPFVRDAYREFAADTRQANAHQREAKRKRTGVSLPMLEEEDQGMTRLRYIAERELGISTSSWTLALEKGSYDFASSRRPTSGIGRDLFSAISGSDERLASLYWQTNDRRQVCSYLREQDWRAKQALTPSALTARDTLLPGVHGGALLGECARCHEAGVGPPIPFHDPDALASRLREPSGSRVSLLEEIRFRLQAEAGAARMPLSRVPSNESLSELMSYLQRLAMARTAPLQPL